MKARINLLALLMVFLMVGQVSAQKIRMSKKNNMITFTEPKRAKGQQDVIELRTAPIDTVRIAIIGVGNRGMGAVHRLSFIPTAKIVALADVNPENIKKAVARLDKKSYPTPDTYTGANDWKEICKRTDIDLVYVCTHWDLHAPIAIEAMLNGKHAAVELPAAVTLEEAWALVETAEKTRRHCMMLENTNYDFFEMATLNMAQKGLLGEIVHAEGSYIHDLRSMLFHDTYYWDKWRLKKNAAEVGNLYPTHGLGPVAHAMNIHRGDKMNFLVCVSSDQFGMTAYAKEKYGENSPEAKAEYKHGDINTTLIKTQKGKTIMIQHDVVSPRPYSRHHILSGTKGYVQKYPNQGLAFEPDAHNFLSAEKTAEMLKKYEHPIVTEIGEFAKTVGGHGGMDFIMDYRLIYCLNNGLPLDQDVYDAVEWSCLVPLTAVSIQNNGMPVRIPDFTRGAWNKVNTVTYFKK